MHRDIVFNLQESFRNLSRLPGHSITYFVLVFFNYLFVIILFVFYINLKYLKGMVTYQDTPYFLNYYFLNSPAQIDLSIFLLILMSIFMLCLNIYTNKTYTKKYYDINQKEMRLVYLLKGKKNIVRTSIIYTGFLINFLSVVCLINWIKIPYNWVLKILNKTGNPGLSIIEFNCFDTSLFLLLLTTTIVIVFFTNYYLYWKLKN